MNTQGGDKHCEAMQINAFQSISPQVSFSTETVRDLGMTKNSRCDATDVLIPVTG